MSFAVGSLVRVRGREWVVLPDSSDELLRIKPLGGSDIESSVVIPSLESVSGATFALPDPEKLGDARSARLLREAVRLGFRASSGPFRSLGAISVEPRPYQLVPLLMALRQNPVRLIVGDDVGVGKTLESLLCAKELLTRGEVERLCILCPPHLAEQWQTEMLSKFSIDAVLVLPSTVSKLERECPPGISIFERFPFTVVSLDYIKQERRRDDFVRTCPEFVIVDEAHTCTQGGQGSQQRFQLLKKLTEGKDRHLILVTATPHSGNEASFRSMLSLIKPEFADMPHDLSGEANRPFRESLAAHFVQRRRADIRSYLQEDTPFPDRLEKDETYRLHPEYRQLLDKAVSYAREVVEDQTGTKFQQRIRWWSALALLRSISSSPAAAIATLRARANNAEAESLEQIEELGKRSVMDLTDAESAEAFDVAPGADVESGDTPTRRKLLELARFAEGLKGAKDSKMLGLVAVVKDLLRDGFNPIVFCRYIQTAEYVAEEIKSRAKGVEVACVTGTLPHDEREVRVRDLAEFESRVLVCTDCLSEGINLQDSFDAVVHADLAWSPTRHEQREGRVDRFNQKSKTVRVVTFYGEDNPIDGIVLNILLKKHKTIRNSLGISVPVPIDSDRVLEAIFESLLLRGANDTTQLSLFEDVELEERKKLSEDWDRAADRERRSRTLFAQNSIKVEEVAKELTEVREALGTMPDLERFVRDAMRGVSAMLDTKQPFTVSMEESRQAVKDAVRYEKPFKATFAAPSPRGAVHLARTHPMVEGLANYVLDSALAGEDDAIATRCGVVATSDVSELTCLLVLRFRFQIVSAKAEMLAEDALVCGFRGTPASPQWLKPEDCEPLLDAVPAGNVSPDMAKHFLRTVISEMPKLRFQIRELAKMRAEKALASHRRVRKSLEGSHAAREVKVQGEPDILGLYLLTPHGGAK